MLTSKKGEMFVIRGFTSIDGVEELFKKISKKKLTWLKSGKSLMQDKSWKDFFDYAQSDGGFVIVIKKKKITFSSSIYYEKNKLKLNADFDKK